MHGFGYYRKKNRSWLFVSIFIHFRGILFSSKYSHTSPAHSKKISFIKIKGTRGREIKKPFWGLRSWPFILGLVFWGCLKNRKRAATEKGEDGGEKRLEKKPERGSAKQRKAVRREERETFGEDG